MPWLSNEISNTNMIAIFYTLARYFCCKKIEKDAAYQTHNFCWPCCPCIHTFPHVAPIIIHNYSPPASKAFLRLTRQTASIVMFVLWHCVSSIHTDIIYMRLWSKLTESNALFVLLKCVSWTHTHIPHMRLGRKTPFMLWYWRKVCQAQTNMPLVRYSDIYLFF